MYLSNAVELAKVLILVALKIACNPRADQGIRALARPYLFSVPFMPIFTYTDSCVLP